VDSGPEVVAALEVSEVFCTILQSKETDIVDQVAVDSSRETMDLQIPFSRWDPSFMPARVRLFASL